MLQIILGEEWYRRKQIPYFVAAGDKGINVTPDHLLVLTPCIKEIIENSSTFHRLYMQGTRIETSLSCTYIYAQVYMLS